MYARSATNFAQIPLCSRRPDVEDRHVCGYCLDSNRCSPGVSQWAAALGTCCVHPRANDEDEDWHAAWDVLPRYVDAQHQRVLQSRTRHAVLAHRPPGSSNDFCWSAPRLMTLPLIVARLHAWLGAKSNASADGFAEVWRVYRRLSGPSIY